MDNPFKGRKIAIATQHHKERVMQPLLTELLDLQCWVPNQFDTDQLGTFSGEIERELSPLEAARRKCDWAMAEFNFDLAISNEGSFGPHPAFFFAYADEEWVLLKDKKNGWEFSERVISLSTNFDAAYCDGLNGVEEFALKVQFPEHALIARCEQNDFRMMHKGIQDWESLMKISSSIIDEFGKVYIETDMRAMNNPTRMKVIGEATEKLLKRIMNLCPQCDLPGFGVAESVSGLPCKLCKMPTKSTLKYIQSCQHCNFHQDQFFPHQKRNEDPMYCDFCNP